MFTNIPTTLEDIQETSGTQFWNFVTSSLSIRLESGLFKTLSKSSDHGARNYSQLVWTGSSLEKTSSCENFFINWNCQFSANWKPVNGQKLSSKICRKKRDQHEFSRLLFGRIWNYHVAKKEANFKNRRFNFRKPKIQILSVIMFLLSNRKKYFIPPWRLSRFSSGCRRSGS